MTSSEKPVPRAPERLAYWYFRLNGFLTTENFIVHPDTGTNQRTDADLFAVRFANRVENMERPMVDDPKVASCATFANVIIAEIKTSQCALNGPWTHPEKMNMHRILKSIGCVPNTAIGQAADSLYASGSWQDSNTTIRVFAVGETINNTLAVATAQQLTWAAIIKFVVERFKTYRREKSSVGQWTTDGLRLKDDALRRDPETRIRRTFGLPTIPITQGVT